MSTRHPDEKTLNDTERKLLAGAVTGTLLDLRTGTAALDDPARGMNWGAGREIRAGLLAGLLTGTRNPDGKAPRSIKLRGARITGGLHLEATTVTCPLLLQDCYFDEPVNLDEVTALTIRLPGCHLTALTARQLRTTGDLTLNSGFAAAGGVRLDGARIGGELNLDGARLAGSGGPALTADGLTVEYGMFCGDGFTATGEVRLPGAHIGGYLVLSGATLANHSGPALTAYQLTVGQSVLCREGFRATGEINLIGARISGQLSLSGASLVNPGGPALSADRLTVGESMTCGDGFTATGEVRLLGARIGGNLDLGGAGLANPGQPVLAADGLTVERDMFCVDGFTATGEVRLPGAHIGGQLSLSGASLANPGGPALTADGLTVEHDMFCRDGFTATGEVNLAGARIGGQLDLDGASLASANGPALAADGLIVEHDMFCGDGFRAAGEVRLLGARIGGQLSLARASLANPGGTALDLEAAEVSVLFLLPQQPPDGAVHLTNAHVGTFYDSKATWPAVLHLQGFGYEHLENDDAPRTRLGWLTRDPEGYTPRLYDQLAAAYRRAGNEQAARKIAVAKQRRRRHAFSPLSWLWYVTVGYGYRPWLAGAWLAVLVALGTWVFSRAYPAHMIAIRSHPPAFHSFAYAFDLLLPVINLGQKSVWQPAGAAYQYWSWALTGAGWVLTTAFVAGLTGIFKRD